MPLRSSINRINQSSTLNASYPRRGILDADLMRGFIEKSLSISESLKGDLQKPRQIQLFLLLMSPLSIFHFYFVS